MKVFEAITKNSEFEENNYLVVKNLWNIDELTCYPPEERGVQINYDPISGEIKSKVDEDQVGGSTSRYNHPLFRQAHVGIRLKIEKVIGMKLYDTYYFDRFYFNGQKLNKHIDRDACEISVTLHIGTSLPKPAADWPVCIKTPDNSDACVTLNPGDAMIYKGCQSLHWRDKLPEVVGDHYYHQVFFHYVLQDGYRAHHAWDRG
ncbi:ferrochelatase [Synechococcus phage S-MbCM6]|uniref:Ferrochelatase n=1 Tax=Synechococcus phage S-MbCM6 TaxID=3126011 RepID=A0A0E3F853_9CAUD|nr:ferrochelatase [Synechococcus phage ACG-2014c]